MKAKKNQDRAIATSLLKGLDLMTIVARRPQGVTIPTIVGRLKIPRTSVVRILHTLELYGLVVRDDKTWRSADRFHEWCSRETYNELKSRYDEAIRQIAAEVGELVELGVLEGEGVRYIDWVQAEHSVTIDPLKSSLYPLHRTATGKLILSQRPDLWSKLTDRRLLAEIERARTTGIAWNRRESDPNITAVATWAAPASAGAPVICIKWPFFRFTENKATVALSAIRRALAKL